MFAFDLIRLNGPDLRQAPLEERRALLVDVLGADRPHGLAFSDSFPGTGPDVFAAASELGLEQSVETRC